MNFVLTDNLDFFNRSFEVHLRPIIMGKETSGMNIDIIW